MYCTVIIGSELIMITSHKSYFKSFIYIAGFDRSLCFVFMYNSQNCICTATEIKAIWSPGLLLIFPLVVSVMRSLSPATKRASDMDSDTCFTMSDAVLWSQCFVVAGVLQPMYSSGASNPQNTQNRGLTQAEINDLLSWAAVPVKNIILFWWRLCKRNPHFGSLWWS